MGVLVSGDFVANSVLAVNYDVQAECSQSTFSYGRFSS